MLAAVLAAVAGWTDWRSRRIPNWLTVPGLILGVVVNTYLFRLQGTKQSLLGAALGLGILLPFVLLRSLGAGDWKLVGAIGAFLGPAHLIAVLFAALIVAGVMALVLIVYKGRVRQTMANMAHMVTSIFTLHLPGPAVSLDNPESLKVPFGVAVAVAVILYSAQQAWGVL